MAILLQDNFNRAANTTQLGNPDVGGPYTVRSGTWGINATGEAYLSTASAGAQVTFPADANLDISFKLPATPTSSVLPGIMIRWIDASNFWLLQAHQTPAVVLYRSVAGTVTQIGPAATPLAVGDTIRLRAFGDQITWFVNDRQYGQLTDQWASVATAVAGLRNGGGSSGRWDDLLVETRTEAFGSWGASPSIELAPLDAPDADATLIPSLYKGRDTALADESEIP